MNPPLAALDAAKDGIMKMSSSALDVANEDDDDSIIIGPGYS